MRLTVVYVCDCRCLWRPEGSDPPPPLQPELFVWGCELPGVDIESQFQCMLLAAEQSFQPPPCSWCVCVCVCVCVGQRSVSSLLHCQESSSVMQDLNS
jgi:hypothetical protein